MKKTHVNFFTFKAKNNFALGFLMGKKFAKFAHQTIARRAAAARWSTEKVRAQKYLAITQKYFPQYVDELRGYAAGAQVNFFDLWTVSLEDEVRSKTKEKCTTIITNDGKLLAHNEDAEKDSTRDICLLRKTISGLTIFEIYYFNTLGGNGVSVNSHGFITTTNTLFSKKTSFGLPRNVIARWFSETKNPVADFQKLKKMPRACGFSFNILNKSGMLWNIEYDSSGAKLTKPRLPFTHTNHFLSTLKTNEANDHTGSSFDRYEVAEQKTKSQMTLAELTCLTNDTSRGKQKSIKNEKTVAKIIIDLKKFTAHVWLRRENSAGTIKYSLKKLF